MTDHLPAVPGSANDLAPIAAHGRGVLRSRATALGPETGKTPDDLALASIHDETRPAKTMRAYQLGQRRFADWCAANDVPFAFPAHSVTAEALALFVTSLADEGLKPASIANYVSGVGAMHRALDLPNPAASQMVRDALKAVRVTKGADQTQATPIRRADIDRALDRLSDNLIDLRDAALIGLAYDTGARAGSLCGFNVGDLSISDGAASIRVRRSKTDQEGKGRSFPVLPDTLARLHRWIAAAGLDREPADTPLFQPLSVKGQGERLTRRDVARIFAQRIHPKASGHSIRVGAAQDMRAAGFGNSDIAHAFGWKGDAMPSRYTAHLDAQDSAAVKLARLQGRA